MAAHDLRSSALAMGALLLASACSATPTPSPLPSPSGAAIAAPSATATPVPISSIGPGEGSLDIIVRPGYAESGENDPAYDWVGPFEAKTGCQVTAREAGTADQMASLVEADGAGSWDGLSASGEVSNRLIADGRIQPIGVEALFPDWKDLWQPLQDPASSTVRGVHYGVSHGWGANLLMWNTGVVTAEPDSWGVVFDPTSAYKGKVTLYDSPISIADAALYLSKTAPELGISDPYELTRTQFDAAVELLRRQRPIVGAYWGTPRDEIAAFENGDAALGDGWPYQAHYLQTEDQPIPVQATVPLEGATAWADSWMLLAGARHPNCMLLWMAWMITPAVQQQVAEFFGEAPANVKACATLDTNPGPLGYKGFCAVHHATDEILDSQGFFWKTPLAECGDARGDGCIDYAIWQQQWDQVKASK